MGEYEQYEVFPLLEHASYPESSFDCDNIKLYEDYLDQHTCME
jgi:hypothetical protein